MKNILIGIGGTGAKCIEATIHLAAAGLLPNSTQIYLVDQDTASALSRRAQELAELYAQVNAIMIEAGTDTFAAAPVCIHTEILQPVEGADSTLERTFGLSKTLRPGSPEFDDAILAQALFTETERIQDMKKGFVAKPSIGSAAFTKASLDNNGLWSTLAAAANGESRSEELGIVLMGSIFGGTGAAGVPTLAQHLKRHTLSRDGHEDRLAAVLMLPYFYVRSDASGKPSAFGPVESGQVPRALRYYSDVQDEWQREKVPLFDGLYLIGLEPMFGVASDSVGGGSGQTNPPLVPELIAGLGACHFLNGIRSSPRGSLGKAWYCARSSVDRIVLDDLPGISSNDRTGRGTRASLASLVRFAFAYYHVYRPLLQRMDSGICASYPFLRHHLDRREVDAPEFRDRVAVLAAFCRKVLTWAGQIDLSRADGPPGIDVALFDGAQFFELPRDSEPRLRFDGPGKISRIDAKILAGIFANLWPERREAASLREVLDRISRPPKESRGHRPQLATFVARLYEATRVVVKSDR